MPEEKFEKNCRHCFGGAQIKNAFFGSKNFWIVCDFHPLARGHIMIILKKHISCFGSLSGETFLEFENLYNKVKNFINNNYGSATVFEHGVVGQTVFHAHIHFLPLTI